MKMTKSITNIQEAIFFLKMALLLLQLIRANEVAIHVQRAIESAEMRLVQ